MEEQIFECPKCKIPLVMEICDNHWYCFECSLTISKLKEQIPDNKCCGIPMETYGDYHWCCDICGYITFKKTNYIPGFPEPKKIEFNPMKHFEDCIRHILNWVLPPNKLDLNEIRDYVKKDVKSPEDVRDILKKMKLSKYYKFTPYIFVELGGFDPPDIPLEHLKRTMWFFKQIIKIREQIPDLSKNNPQYSYLAYKIFEAILPPNNNIFYFIHLPSATTLKKRDKEWKLICEELRIIYKPTI